MHPAIAVTLDGKLELTESVRAYANQDFIYNGYGTAMTTSVGVAFGSW